MKNILYTTIKGDVWAEDVNDLLDALGLFWKPYKFTVEENEDKESFNIVATDARFEATEGAEAAFTQICGVITVAIQMWIEGHSTGRYK